MLVTLLFTATVYAASQGSALFIALPEEPGMKSIQLTWDDRKIPFVHTEVKWETVTGVDLDAKPGDHTGELDVTFADGHTDKRPIILRVDPVKFPTTELTVEDKYVELSPENLKRANRETKELDAIYATVTPEILWAKSFIVPIPGQTKGTNFGHRRIFNGQPRAPHAGSDLKATTGTPVHAANRGRVVLAKDLFFTGNTVVIDHGLGIYTLYAHLSRIDVKVLQMIDEDEVLGLAGATGRVTGPHLHWGAKIQGARVDPFSLLSIE